MSARIWASLDRVFLGPLAARRGLLGRLLRVLRYPYAVVRDLARGEINLHAMGLVYTTLLSVVPAARLQFRNPQGVRRPS